MEGVFCGVGVPPFGGSRGDVKCAGGSQGVPREEQNPGHGWK